MMEANFVQILILIVAALAAGFNGVIIFILTEMRRQNALLFKQQREIEAEISKVREEVAKEYVSADRLESIVTGIVKGFKDA